MKPTLALLPTMALLAALGRPAMAQTVAPGQVAPPSPEQARALEQQIRTWLSQLADGKATLPQSFIQFTPQGDHYLVTVPLDFGDMLQPANAAISLQAKMLDSTRWQLDGQKITSPLTLTTKHKVKDAPDPKNPGKPGMHEETLTTVLTLGDQANTQTFDPTFATPTTGHSSLSSFDLVQSGSETPVSMHLGPMTGETTTTPVDPAHVDFQMTGAGEAGTLKGQTPDGAQFTVTTDRVRFAGAVSGFAHDSYVPVMRALFESAAAGQTAQKLPDDPAAHAASQEAARNLLIATKGLLTGARLDESVEGIKFNFDGHAGTLGKYELAVGGDAPQDMLSANLSLTLDGLALADVPPPFADYVPTHFSIRPTLSNISVADLTRMAMNETAPGAPARPSPADEAALFNHGGIDFGFDALELDVAGAKIAGTGKFVMSGPQDVSGQAELSATGLDAFITKAQADPMLAKGVPVVIFLKGIAHLSGDQAVWQIAVANKKVLVNGVDLSALTGGMMK